MLNIDDAYMYLINCLKCDFSVDDKFFLDFSKILKHWLELNWKILWISKMLSKNIKEDFKYILRFMNIIRLLIVWMLMNLGKLYMNLDKNFKKFRDGENSSI